MRVLPALLATLTLAATACSPNGQSAGPGTDADPTSPTATSPTTTPADGTSRVGSVGSGGSGEGGAGTFPRFLTPFSDCTAFLDHVKAEAAARVGPYGLDGNPWGHWIEDDVFMATDEATAERAEEAGDADAAGAPAAPNLTPADDGAGEDAASGPDFTATNVQELGVDEPDIIKTDGTRIITVSENRLSYIDVSGEPALTDTLQIPEGWGHELFIRGDRALLFTNGGQWGHPMPVDVVVDDAEADFAGDDALDALDAVAPEQFGPATLIIEVDLSDPGNLRITSSLSIEGQYLSARAIDQRVRLAVTSPPTRLPWLYPQNPNGEDRAEEANRQIVAESTLDDWLPGYELTVGDRTSTGPLLSCDRAHRPAEFSGFDMISIIDLDLGSGLAGSADDVEAVGVLASGQTVYSSLDRMYVATTKWVGADVVGDAELVDEWNEDYETDIHAFSIAAGEPTDYVASGTIAGSLLNQFSLDEHQGYLRAITTDGSPWSRDGTSETHLVVYEEQGDRLVAVGEVGGLGVGEQLYSARLMGDIGFAVTFRQIDPFYVLDLSDPTDPRVTGELKIPGVSTYLHPVGDDRVLGVGQNATEDGGTVGLKLSLFDVSDPADPREIAVWTLDDANSPAEWDHRAFQMWGSTAIVPVQTWDGGFNGAILFDIGDAITEVGRIAHLPSDADPASDCRQVTADELTPEASELYWMTTDGYGRVQVCESDATGGWGDWYCDRIPTDEIQHWFNDPAVAEADLEAIGAVGDAVVEICWSDGGHQQAIQRSLVIDDVLWTMTPSAIQANDLADLGVVGHFSLR